MQLQTMDPGGSKPLLQVHYTCVHCGGRSADLSNLEEHIRVEHKKKLILNPVDGMVKGIDEPEVGSKGLLQVPYACFHCGGRSTDLSTLEDHIRVEHKKKLILTPVNGTVKGVDEPEVEHEPEEDDTDPDPHHMLLEDLVEVQIKEEPEFLVPLDLSRKDNAPSASLPSSNEVWIKEDPDAETNFIPDPPPEPPNPLPKIRVASEAVLKAPAPPPPLLLRLQGPEQHGHPPHMYPYGNNYGDKLLRARLANSEARFRPIRPLPPLIALPRMVGFSRPQYVPPSDAPKERMPNHFPQTPYLLKVPYTCYHCGGRSGDLETLKTHIETMHDPEAMYKQKLAMEAKKKLLGTLQESKVLKIKIPKPPKIPKDKTAKVKPPKDKEKKVIIKIPKPLFKIKERRETLESKRLAKMANSRFKCPFCPFGGNSFRGLILHATIKHEQERALKRLEAEEKEESEKDPLSKPKPKKTFFYCLFCDYKSVQKPQLKKHMYAIHGKEKQYKCPYCNHKTAYGENMRWHVVKHRFVCEQCDYRSISRANLLEHQNKYCPAWIDGGATKPPSSPVNKVSRRGRKPKAMNYAPPTIKSEPDEPGNELDPTMPASNDHCELQIEEVLVKVESPDDEEDSVRENGEESSDYNSFSANSIDPSESKSEVNTDTLEMNEECSEPLQDEPSVPLQSECSETLQDEPSVPSQSEGSEPLQDEPSVPLESESS